MIAELKKNEYERIRTLVNPLKFHLGLNAIIDAEMPGRVWVVASPVHIKGSIFE